MCVCAYLRGSFYYAPIDKVKKYVKGYIIFIEKSISYLHISLSVLFFSLTSSIDLSWRATRNVLRGTYSTNLNWCYSCVFTRVWKQRSEFASTSSLSLLSTQSLSISQLNCFSFWYSTWYKYRNIVLYGAGWMRSRDQDFPRCIRGRGDVKGHQLQ